MATGNGHPLAVPLVVIGVGNLYRRDDSIGLLIARRVREGVPPGIPVLEESGEGAALMEAWRGAETVILCDAVRSGAEPGTIHHLEADQQPIPAGFFNYSTHAFSVAEAVEMARALGELPPRLIIYGIEGADFTAGTELSPAVERAAHTVIREVLAAVHERITAAKRG
jgi:hydrogenase maturation protease